MAPSSDERAAQVLKTRQSTLTKALTDKDYEYVGEQTLDDPQTDLAGLQVKRGYEIKDKSGDTVVVSGWSLKHGAEENLISGVPDDILEKLNR
jgi:hypothetical protein